VPEAAKARGKTGVVARPKQIDLLHPKEMVKNQPDLFTYKATRLAKFILNLQRCCLL
jgi:hypothetical protein